MFLVCLGFAAPAQLNPERFALNKIKKGEWALARKILDKTLRKDSLSIEASYVYSILFFTPKYFLFNIDSAHRFWKITNDKFEACNERTKERLKKFPVDSTILASLKHKIDSAAFEQAKELNTEAGYIHFIQRYSDASQIKSAIELRDEAAFVIALKQNSHQAFQTFLDHYPESHRSAEARQRFERLLFEFHTKNKSLLAYKEFVSHYPSSPFADVAMKNIFEMSTEDGTEKSFEDFIKQYPTGTYAKRASGILLHLKLAQHPSYHLTDSLKTIYPLRDWLPINEKEKWGFMDEAGNVTFQPTLQTIAEKYFCSPLIRDFIHIQDAIAARNGTIIFKGYFKEVNELGSGFIRARTDSSSLIIHKSGWALSDKIPRGVLMIGSRFIACQKSTGWGLLALNGKMILPFSFEKIVDQGKYVILSKSGKEILVGLDNMIAYSQGRHAPVVADEIKTLGDHFIWVRNGSLEQILDENLLEVIPFDRHAISFSSAGFIIKKNSLYSIKGWTALENISFEFLQIFEPWLVTQKHGEKQSLFYIPSKKEIVVSADSIWFDRSFIAVAHGDSVRLWRSDSKFFTISKHDDYTIAESRDSTAFLLIRSGTKVTVRLAEGFHKLFTSSFTGVWPVLKNVFRFIEKGKHGLINEKGQVILKPEYDNILFSNGSFALLRDRQFGNYNQNTKKLIKPVFDSNLRTYGHDWIIGSKEKKLGFIRSDEAARTNFLFDEIEYWSDTLALVTQNGKRALYSIPQNKNRIENITYFHVIEEDKPQRLAIFTQGNLSGLIGNSSGVIVKPEFEELAYQTVNNKFVFIGIKPAKPGTMQVTYFQATGKIVRSQVLPKEIAYSLICND